MNIPYRFHQHVIARTPRLPLVTSLQHFNLQQLIGDKMVMEALYLASPVLYDELVKYAKGKITAEKDIKKLTLSAARYYLRMSGRCTPFGLFSGCSVATWQQQQDTPVVLNNKTIRHTRFDMHYLCALAQHLAKLPFIKERILYYPNSAMYKMGEEMRYVEYKYVNGKRHHTITAVQASEYVAAILAAAKTGITFHAIVQLLVSDEITTGEAEDFANEMIEAQVLVHELEPAITGDEFLNQLMATLTRINQPAHPALTSLIAMLQKTMELLQQMDLNGVNDIAAYRQVMDHMQQFGVPFEPGKLFQTDVYFGLQQKAVSTDIQQRLLAALHTINQLNKRHPGNNLQAFMKRFSDRYEDREMPLLEALDTETGIGYLESRPGDIVPLVDDLVLPAPPVDGMQVRWSKTDHLLLTKLLEAGAKRAYNITLHPDEIGHDLNNWEYLPPSLAVMFTILGNGQIFLDNAGGSSAVNLLGRFAHGNQEIGTMVQDIIDAEETNNPDVIYAEIIHLPESRLGNVLLHPAFRTYEIPFLARSGVDETCQVALQDLYITVRDNITRLYSKKLDKQIIPRLSNAHNYSHNALPVYQFLCDLQLQHHQGGIGFSWNVLQSQCTFLPRVTVQDVIVSAAQWNFSRKDIELLKGRSGDELQAALALFRQQWMLPALVVLADGDNELLINLEDNLMVELWLDTVKKRNGFLLKEFFDCSVNAAVKDSEGNAYNNQFVTAMIRNTAAYVEPGFAKKQPLVSSVVADFSLGSEWVYLKIFCGTKAADKILVNGLRPLVQQLTEERIIDKFFFLRHNKGGLHLRTRFHLVDTAMLGRLLQLFQQHIHGFETDGLVWKIESDTYKRELDRYGANTVELAENLFHYDSLAVLDMLHVTEGTDREETRWLWAIRAIDEFLDGFGLQTGHKLTFIEIVKDQFHKEYRANAMLLDQLSAKYRKYKSLVESINDRSKDLDSAYAPIIRILQEKKQRQAAYVHVLMKMHTSGTLDVALLELLPSYVHMLVNRIIAANPRLHELVLYDMLFMYYRSQSKRAQQPSRSKDIQAA